MVAEQRSTTESISAPTQSASETRPPLPPNQVQSRQTTLEVAFGQTKPKRNLRTFITALALITPIIAMPIASRLFVDRAAITIATIVINNLDAALAWRNVAAPTIDPPDHIPPPPSRSIVESASPHSPGLSGQSSTPTTKTPRGILVRADAVMRAVRRGGRPDGVFTPATTSRPAGMSLVGINSYGTALRDGDILTQVGGTPATSVGAVVGAVAGALSHGAKTITGVVWRDNQRIDVAVEIPVPAELAHTKPRRRKSVTK